MLYSAKKIHFIGIGGIGMSGIAELLFNKDFFVTGSDISDSTNVQRLKDLGIKIFIGHDKKNISNSELVIYSDAIPKNNIELKEAVNKNLLVLNDFTSEIKKTKEMHTILKKFEISNSDSL